MRSGMFMVAVTGQRHGRSIATGINLIMNRLTTHEEYPHGAEGKSVDRLTGCWCRGKFEATACVEKLSRYEDTGLEPEEIMDGKMLNGWIRVEERVPDREEWMGVKGKEHYLRRMEIAVDSDTIEYFIVFYDGYKWFDKFGRTYAGVKAWKIHEPFNPLN